MAIILLAIRVSFAAECYRPYVPVPLFYAVFVTVSVVGWNDAEQTSRGNHRSGRPFLSNENAYGYTVSAVVSAIAAGYGIGGNVFRQLTGYTFGT